MRLAVSNGAMKIDVSARPSRSLLLVVMVACGAPEAAWADEVSFGEHDVRSVFFVSKTSNDNRVHFTLRLDADCHPRGEEPVEPYWQLPQDGGEVLELLSTFDLLGYGTTRQDVRVSATGGSVRVVFRALSSRPVVFMARRTATGCEARALMDVGGVRAYVQQVHVQMSAPLTIEYAELRARRLSDDIDVTERISP
jgi:hypothetical protein